VNRDGAVRYDLAFPPEPPMPKKPPTLDHAHAVQQAVETLVHSVTALVDRVQAAVHGPAGAPSGRGPGRNNPRLKAALKASWARMTPAERKARVAKMLKGRGLGPKSKRS
jgi:hypothetical protein